MSSSPTTSPPDSVPLGQRLSGRRVLITGAASGIGRTTAELFAAEAAALALLDQAPDGLSEVATALGAKGIPTDITDESSVNRAVHAAAAALGGIDGVVNVAGIHLRGSLADVTTAEFRRVVEVNLTGMYSVLRSCLPWLAQAENASVVNISSGQGLRPDAPDRSAYAASKGAVVALSRALAAELAPGIRVNTVCPGLVITPMTVDIRSQVTNYSMKRLAEPLGDRPGNPVPDQ